MPLRNPDSRHSNPHGHIAKHPQVVRRVSFCRTKNWQLCGIRRPKRHRRSGCRRVSSRSWKLRRFSTQRKKRGRWCWGGFCSGTIGGRWSWLEKTGGGICMSLGRPACEQRERTTGFRAAARTGSRALSPCRSARRHGPRACADREPFERPARRRQFHAARSIVRHQHSAGRDDAGGRPRNRPP